MYTDLDMLPLINTIFVAHFLISCADYKHDISTKRLTIWDMHVGQTVKMVLFQCSQIYTHSINYVSVMHLLQLSTYFIGLFLITANHNNDVNARYKSG